MYVFSIFVNKIKGTFYKFIQSYYPTPTRKRKDVVRSPFCSSAKLRLALKSFLTIVCRLLTGSLNNPVSNFDKPFQAKFYYAIVIVASAEFVALVSGFMFIELMSSKFDHFKLSFNKKIMIQIYHILSHNHLFLISPKSTCVINIIGNLPLMQIH